MSSRSGHQGGHQGGRQGGRQGGHQGGARTPRGTSQTRSQAGSQQPKHKKRKQQTQPQTQKPPRGNQAHHNTYFSPEQMTAVRKMVRDAVKSKDDKNPAKPLDPDAVADAANDLSVTKEERLSKLASRSWSNYPVPLPPTLNAQSVFAVRSALANANNREMLEYYSPQTYQMDGQTPPQMVLTDGNPKVVKRMGSDYELGTLECYDGISTNDAGQFLSCDFVNPAYLEQVAKRGKSGQYAPLQNSSDAQREWMAGRSCFVYAPPDTILSKTTDGVRELMPKKEAIALWNSYATVDIEATPARRSGDIMATKLLSNFWCYEEEFVEFVNQDSKNKARPNFTPLKEKGRIGMLFPISPYVMEDGNILNVFTTPTDSIGWGVVSHIGDEELDADLVITSWNHLQSVIGKYILLTSLWSSTSQDAYEVNVDEKVLKKIYQRVVSMTNGTRIVNVRRGADAYGRLCVQQKKIVLDPSDESFGIAKTDPVEPAANLYVTQIFTCVESQTAYDPEWKRVQMSPVYQSHSKMSGEERTLKNIFQMSNNKIIQCMKSAQYREVIQAFWLAAAENRPTSMRTETEWKIKTMKAMVMAMISTTYNVMFQRLPAKAACDERTERFMNITKNYRKWFIDAKCMATDAFLKKYEDDLKAKAIKADQFSGMMPGMYTEHKAHDTTDSTIVTALPQIRRKKPVILELVLAGPDADNEELKKLKNDFAALKDSSDEYRLKLEGDRLAKLKEKFATTGPVGPDEYAQFLADDSVTPTTLRVAKENAGLFSTKARWGQDDTDSFTARLAKLQDW